MHALITIPAAARRTANDLAVQYFDPHGGELTFSLPLYAASSAEDAEVVGYFAAPEFLKDERLDLAQQLAAGVPGCTIQPYDLDLPFDLDGALAALGYRRALPQPLT